MPTIVEEAVATQRRYYSETATNYEQMHAHEGNGETFNKKFIEAILQMLGARSVLDVGPRRDTGFTICVPRSRTLSFAASNRLMRFSASHFAMMCTLPAR